MSCCWCRVTGWVLFLVHQTRLKLLLKVQWAGTGAQARRWRRHVHAATPMRMQHAWGLIAAVAVFYKNLQGGCSISYCQKKNEASEHALVGPWAAIDLYQQFPPVDRFRPLTLPAHSTTQGWNRRIIRSGLTFWLLHLLFLYLSFV